MLQSLHVKNLALMEETEVEFSRGLNILTGETGAGKSLLLGSVSLALGGRFDKDMLRKGTDAALVELTFLGNQTVNEKLHEMDLWENEDGSVLISRKMQESKSVYRVNGEVVTAKQVKELAEELLDIHGQHEHQSLLKSAKHLEVLDLYARNVLEKPLTKVKESYQKICELREIISKENLDEKARKREQSLAEFEVQEILNANLCPGEDEALEKAYQKMRNARKIAEALSMVYGNTSEVAGEATGRALRAMDGVIGIDDELDRLHSVLVDVEALLADFNAGLSRYQADLEFDRSTFLETEERLNVINNLKDKYGKTIEAILAYAQERQAYLDKLSDFDAYMDRTRKALEDACEEYRNAAGELTNLRQKYGKEFSKRMEQALHDLNFLTVHFETSISPTQAESARGMDHVEFLISVNPGEDLKPISQVASGGELSRIMLAIKTILAGKDDIDTLIFDEIDAGISGKTAWKVSERLHLVSKEHQVICITHLPQIAAMADHHFKIEKVATDNSTVTDIVKLDVESSIQELARLLGSDTLSDAAVTNALEMKKEAVSYKDHIVVL